MSRLFIIIFFLFGAGVVGLFYLKPEWQKFQTLRQENKELQQTSAEFDSLTERRDALIEEVNAISKEQRNLIGQALPKGPAAADFLVGLEALTKKRAIALRRVDLASTIEVKGKSGQPQTVGAVAALPNKEAIFEFPISLSVSSSYESFKEFLHDLEKNLRLIDIQEISFFAPPKGQLFDFNLRLKTYYQ